jgi:hypothetical protein
MLKKSILLASLMAIPMIGSAHAKWCSCYKGGACTEVQLSTVLTPKQCDNLCTSRGNERGSVYAQDHSFENSSCKNVPRI